MPIHMQLVGNCNLKLIEFLN